MKQVSNYDIALVWDAGDHGCGQLILGLKRSLDQVEAGQYLHVTAHDAGAVVDLPAWCRMTGHRLVFAQTPHFVLQKRHESLHE